jgi:hypothetical protein
MEDELMRYMLLQSYGAAGADCPPISEWAADDIRAHIEFQHVLNAELLERGELIDAQGLAGPEQAKFVTSDGISAPVITDGPFPEAKELLAGYRIVDVESAERAIEIAARISAAPGADGAPIGQAIEVRAVLSAPDPEV